jgi:hypothetical protein
MIKRIEATITIGDRKVTLEGPEDFVREEIERLAGAARPVAKSEPNPVSSGAASASAGSEAGLNEADFIAQKKPSGHNEIVAVLAYVLAKNGRAEFTPDEMKRAYLRANVRPPKVVGQALRDAKNTRDFLEKGSKVGTFKLSDHGERTVLFDLPRSVEAGEK